MPEGNAVKTMFAGIAAKYDSANHLLSGCFDFYWRYRLSQKVKAVQPKSIIDLATGSGDVAFKLREQLPSDCTIKGMDFCLPMLEEARRKSKLQEKYSNLQFELGDCMDLPLEDCCCDAVTLSFGLRNFENRRKGLQEILRILNPRARCLFWNLPSLMAVASLLLRVPKLLLTLGGTHRNRRQGSL